MTEPANVTAQFIPNAQGNRSFSTSIPNLQIAIDSTSLGAFKQCPRKYYYSIVLGFQPQSESVHLTFGLLMHEAREKYDRLRFEGADHETALDEVVYLAMVATWNRELARPWVSGHSQKNRLTLIRSIIWYLDQYGDNDSLQTLVLANGKPAVELSFQFDSQLRFAFSGEPLILCGHLDRIATLNDVPYIVDLKTTTHALDPRWFASFTPDNQFSLYTLAGRTAFRVPVESLIVDGVQLGVNFSRFSRGLVPRDKASLSEWYHGLGFWTAQMEQCAVQDSWPQNDKACGMYGGCEFRGICSKSPGERQRALELNFRKRTWDPMLKRGDI